MKLTEKQRADLYKVVFDTADGRAVLADILTKGFVFQECPNDLAEGGRRLALHIMKYVGYSRERFPEEMTATEKEIMR